MRNPKQSTDRAKEIKDQYDYMDKLPTKAWVWECARRTKEYQECFHQWKGKANNVYTYQKDIKGLIRSSKNMGVWYWPHQHVNAQDNQYSIIQLRDWPGIQAFCALPNYAIPWNEFRVLPGVAEPRSYRFLVGMQNGIDSLEWHRSNHDKELDGAYNPILFDTGEKASTPRDVYEFLELWLTPAEVEDCIFVGISRRARKKDIESLIRTLRGYLKKNKLRKRPDSWKFYLLTYDLKTQQNLTLNKIGDILQEAYPNHQLSDEDVKRYYHNSLDLIEHHNYLNYLLYA